MARRVFLTGATGFIGSRLASRLRRRGDSLVVLVRPTSDAAALEALGAAIVRGELTDATRMAAAMAGCDAAVHLAAIYEIGRVDRAAVWRVNVDGTRAFLEAAERARVPRAVHVSTTVALPDAAPDEPESAAVDAAAPDRLMSAYERTKAEAHGHARAAQRRDLPLVIVCPSYVYGPGDEGPGARFMIDLLRGRVPALPADPSWYSFVHVDDVVAGVAAALDRGRLGAVYVLSGEHRSLNDFAAEVCRLGGRRAPRLKVPRTMALLVGSAADLISRVAGARPAVSREAAAMASGMRRLHSRAPAVSELGWRARPLSEGLPETVASHLRAGASRAEDLE